MNNWSYFNLQELIPTRIVNRFDDKKGNRFYYFLENEEVQVASGITTPFGKVSTERYAIEKWKEDNENWQELLNASSEYGTLEHELFADIGLNKPIVMEKLELMESIAMKHGKSPDMPRKDMLSFMRFCEDCSLTPMIVEGVIVWQDENGNWLAMTIDMLAKLNIPKKVKVMVEDGIYQRGEKKGEIKYKEVTETQYEEKIILVDFKSNFFEKDSKDFYEGHKMQLIGAKKAVFQNFGIEVDDVYNWSPNNWRKEPTYTFYKHDLNESDYALFDLYWNLICVKGYNRPEGKILVTGLKSASDYEFKTYKEYAGQYLLEKENYDKIINENN